MAINSNGRDRLSIPLFCGPDFAWRVSPVPDVSAGSDDNGRRRDGDIPQAFEGTYGDRVVANLGKVSPELGLLSCAAMTR